MSNQPECCHCKNQDHNQDQGQDDSCVCCDHCEDCQDCTDCDCCECDESCNHCDNLRGTNSAEENKIKCHTCHEDRDNN